AAPSSSPRGGLDTRVGAATDSVSGEQLVLWSGTGQTGRLGQLLPRSLAVVLVDSAGRPIADREVRFAVAPGGGNVDRDSVRTSDSGLAATSWRLGRNPSALEVRAYVADRPELTVRFTATADGPPPVAAAPSLSEPSEDPVSEPGPESIRESTAPGPEREGPAVARPARARAWSVGGVHTCRVNGAGGVSCWGPGGEDERALGSVIWGVAAGVFHVCAVTDASTVGCWRVGGGERQAISGERSLPGDGRPVELAVGSEHVCARTDDGRVVCWGSNGRGQLGQSGSSPGSAVVEGLTDVAQVAAGWFHTCALTRRGDAYCWGANDVGQLGTGGSGDRTRPTPVAQPGPLIALAAGASHTCALTPNGAAWCWGENQYGQLGTGAITSSARPTRVDSDLSFRSLVAGGVHTCGLTEAGNAWCWGRNLFGQLGDGSTEDSSAPVPVAGAHTFARLGGGGAHTCGETVNGTLYCWGNNIQGQVGDGTRDNRTAPVRAGGL
ncbi:MAG: hypothetical protein R3314_09685, partial [Longimicrobiales bacterium]|nr:hypothetical protein [Longimicrobiales bacterium]